MSRLTEAIELSRAKHLAAVQKEEAKEKAILKTERERSEAVLAEYKARESSKKEAAEKALSECRQMLIEAHILELFAEVNKEIFNDTGKFVPNVESSIYNPGMTSSLTRKTLVEENTLYSSNISLKGKVGKTFVLLSAMARIPSEMHPTLTISCRTGKDPGRLISLFEDPLYGDRSSESFGSLNEKLIEGQEEPVKPWQDVDQVRGLISDVLVAQGVALPYV